MNAGFWHQAPLVRFFIPFVIGCGISMFFPLGLMASTLLFVCVFTVTLILHSSQKKTGLWFTLSFFFLGIVTHQWQDIRHRADYFEKHAGNYLLIRIAEEPVARKRSWKTVAEICGVRIGDSTLTVSGTILLYIQKQSDKAPVTYNDHLWIPRSSINEVKPPSNPNEFNYKRYLAFKHIHHQSYIPAEKLVFARIPRAKDLHTYVYAIQSYFREVIATHIGTATEKGIAQALLYGNDDEIDDETMQSYAHTGTLHVLAVSGMHVGIIFMFLSNLLKWMEKRKRGKWYRAIILLSVLWMYSLLCNLSPSILRATVMFSFIILADAMQRKANIYNTLAASAFFLMLFDANMIASVGFQLSYMAVLGIVFLQPYIYRWYYARFYLTDQIWKISAVSIAAQLATMPIGMLYFHQFPFCFLFSNLIIIPLTNIILYGCLLLMTISPIPLVADVVGECIKWIIRLTNTLVKWVEQIPFAYTDGIHLSIAQTILIYLIIGGALAYFIRVQRIYLHLTALLAAVYCLLVVYIRLEQLNQHTITVYRIPKHTAIRVMKGTQSILIADSALLSDKEKIKFHLTQHKWASGIAEEMIYPYTGLPINLYSDSVSVYITGSIEATHVEQYFSRYLILTQYLPPASIDRYRPECIIIGSSITAKDAKKLRTYCTNMNIPYYSVSDSVAFQLSL